jgi:hypothetical protein
MDGHVDPRPTKLCDRVSHLPLIHHLLQFRITDPRVLQRVGGVLVAELALHGGDVAGLLMMCRPIAWRAGVKVISPILCSLAPV